jgi:hypothetical protein
MLLGRDMVPSSKALHRLSRRKPTSTEQRQIFEEIREASDRAVAILAATFVEDALEYALIDRSLKHLDERTHNRLFERGPLQNFDAKILLTSALGLTGPRITANLFKLKSIRNVFAHARINVSFKTKEIHDLCMSLNLSPSPELDPADDSLFFPPSPNARDKYIGTTKIAVDKLFLLGTFAWRNKALS